MRDLRVTGEKCLELLRSSATAQCTPVAQTKSTEQRHDDLTEFSACVLLDLSAQTSLLTYLRTY